MLGGIEAIKYSAAIASARAGFGGLLSENDWAGLLAASNLEEILSRLGGTVYGAVSGQDPAGIEGAERRLRGRLARRLRIPISFLRGRARELIDWLWRPLEMHNLIMVLRGVHHGVDRSRIRADLVDLGPASSLDWQGLTEAGSMSQVIDRLPSRPPGRFYARALSDALTQYQRREEVFVLEVALNLAYHRELRSLIDAMWGSDRREAERYAGTMIDSRNLLWAYRHRVFFRSEPETILAYSLPRGGRVDASVLKRAATGEPLEDVVTSVWNGRLPGLERITDRSEREALVELELVFRRLLHKQASRVLSGYPMHLGVLLAWTVLLEAEIDDLITVMEGVDNGWAGERIRDWLISSRGRS